MTIVPPSPPPPGSPPGPHAVSPGRLAEIVAPLLDSALVGFDVDGVLAPIVEHAEQAQLLPGIDGSLEALATRTAVVIVSGRSLASLERLFGFPPGLHVIGSHGLELRGAEPMELDTPERATYARLAELVARAVEEAGDGAWLERKPASVALHTRGADPGRAGPAAARLAELAEAVAGAQVKLGHEVVELLVRTADKGTALLALAGRLGRSPIVFLGDDVTDEDAFVRMETTDVSVRVGPGDSAARYRLADPDEVAAFIALLA